MWDQNLIESQNSRGTLFYPNFSSLSDVEEELVDQSPLLEEFKEQSHDEERNTKQETNGSTTIEDEIPKRFKDLN